MNTPKSNDLPPGSQIEIIPAGLDEHGNLQLQIGWTPAPLRPVYFLERALERFPQTGKRVDRTTNEYRQEGHCRCGECKPWPTWCFLPASCFGEIVSDELKGEAGQDIIRYHTLELATLATWRVTQGIYRFHPSCLTEILNAPLAGKLPAERLRRLPEYCVYVDTPNMNWFGEELVGFWAHLAWDAIRDAEILVFLLDKENGLEVCGVELGDWSLRDGVQKLDDAVRKHGLQNNLPTEEPKNSAADTAAALAPLVSMLLYLCSDKADIRHSHIPGARPSRPSPKQTPQGWQWRIPQQPVHWAVGGKAGALPD